MSFLFFRVPPLRNGCSLVAILAVAWLLCVAAQAQAQAPALDSDAPIDITADELEVRQQEKQAIFSGNVIARQGNITMRSGRMLVFYDAAATGNKNGEGPTSISKIEADGSVFFASPQETARSSRAIYDVKSEQIRMFGNVTLTRGESVVKGAALVYNLQTGRSVLQSAQTGSEKPGERVRGLFVPGEKENAQ